MRFYYLNSIASRSCPTLEMVAGKERWWAARRDGGWKGEMVAGKETAAGKERRRQARRDGSRQGEMAGGNVKVALFQIYLAPVIPEVCKGEHQGDSLNTVAASLSS